MIEKRFIFSALFFVVVMSSQDAFSQKTQMLIAKNSVGKLQAAIANNKNRQFKMAILSEGIKASELTEKDRKTRKWPETWAIKSYLSSYIAITDSNENNSNKYYDLALKAIDSAKKFENYQDNSGLIAAANYNINIKKQQKGNVAYAKKDFSAAYNYLKEVSDFFPKDTVLAINAALSAEGTKNDNTAFDYYQRAKENGVRNPVVFQRMATILRNREETDKAIGILNEGLKFNPYSMLLNNDYINLLLDLERYAEASEVIENTLDIETKNKLLYYLYGYLQQKNSNMSVAETAFNKSLTLDKNYFDALYQLGLVYINLGNEALAPANKDVEKFSSFLNRAESVLVQAHENKPKDKSTINLLIEIYSRKNRFDRVQELKAQLDGF